MEQENETIQSAATPREKLTSTLIMLCSTLLWGSSFVVVKDAVDGFPAGLIAAIRMAGGGLVLAAVLWKRWKRMNWEILWRGALLGVLYAVGIVLQTSGLKLTTPGKSAFLTAAYCVIVPFVEWMMMQHKPTAKSLIASLICLTGIGLVSLTDNFSVSAGDLLTLLCSIVFAVHIVFLGKSILRCDAALLSTVMLVLGGGAALAYSLLCEPMPESVGLPTVLRLAYLAIPCTALAMLGQTHAQKSLSPTVISIILGFEAIFGAIFSAIFYGEAFTARCLVGFALIFFAALFSEISLPARKRKGAAAEQTSSGN